MPKGLIPDGDVAISLTIVATHFVKDAAYTTGLACLGVAAIAPIRAMPGEGVPAGRAGEAAAREVCSVALYAEASCPEIEVRHGAVRLGFEKRL